MKITRRRRLWAAVLVMLPAQFVSLNGEQLKSLVIAGRTRTAKVIQVDGQNYAEVLGLARLTHSSITFNGSQIVLTLQGAGDTAAAPLAPAPGFCRTFVTAGIELMAEIREWHAALRNAVERSYPIQETGWTHSAIRPSRRSELRQFRPAQPPTRMPCLSSPMNSTISINCATST